MANELLMMDTQEDSMKGQYLMFPIGEESYGIAIKFVLDIIEKQIITAVPELPFYMKGVFNLRGTIIPVVDIRLRFNREPIEYTDRTCIIVVGLDGMQAGLLVDTVSEVLEIDDEQVIAPPAHGNMDNHFVFGIGKTPTGSKLLLDCHKLFGENEGTPLEELA